MVAYCSMLFASPQSFPQTSRVGIQIYLRTLRLQNKAIEPSKATHESARDGGGKDLQMSALRLCLQQLGESHDLT